MVNYLRHGAPSCFLGRVIRTRYVAYTTIVGLALGNLRLIARATT